jgi:hypothetical protein
MSKFKEIEVWYSEHYGRIYKDGESMPLDAIKAKVVLPAQPQVIEFPLDCTGNKSFNKIIAQQVPQRTMEQLEGKFWHIVATEVIE